jgi:hypothetical protein
MFCAVSIHKCLVVYVCTAVAPSVLNKSTCWSLFCSHLVSQVQYCSPDEPRPLISNSIGYFLLSGLLTVKDGECSGMTGGSEVRGRERFVQERHAIVAVCQRACLEKIIRASE